MMKKKIRLACPVVSVFHTAGDRPKVCYPTGVKSLFNELSNKKLNAFTLTELLVVLVIIGILVLLALPNLMPLISKAKSTEAKLQLEHLHTLEKTHFYEYSKFSSDLSALGFVQEKLVTDGEDGRANYRIEIVEAEAVTFLARGTAVVDFDGDGIFNVWEIDQDKNLKEVTPD